MSINDDGIMKSLDDQIISEVLNFVYLGSEVHSNEVSLEETSHTESAL